MTRGTGRDIRRAFLALIIAFKTFLCRSLVHIPRFTITSGTFSRFNTGITTRVTGLTLFRTVYIMVNLTLTTISQIHLNSIITLSTGS